MRFADQQREAVAGRNPPGAPYIGYVAPAPVTFTGYYENPFRRSSPATVLASMMLTCAQWGALTWAERLSRAAWVISADNALAGTSPATTPFNSAYSYLNASNSAGATQLAHAIDTYCLGQGIASTNQYVTKSTISSAFTKGSGAIGDLIPTLTTDQCNAQVAAGVAAAEDTIKLTGKNYVVGFLVGAGLGALAMHLSMGGK